LGCHTWFKVKSKHSLEDLREIWLNKQKEWIDKWDNYKENPDCKERQVDGIFGNLSQEQFDWYSKVHKRQFDFVKKKIIKSDFVHHLYKDLEDEKLFEYHNGILYSDNGNLPHDIFRIGDYPEDKLFSLEDTLGFIEKNREKIYYGTASSQAQAEEEAIKLLKDFWVKNPIAMIDFG
jgi:hypothetical protein